MPFTPLHMGPGLVIKAVLQRHFSLMVFGWAQILIDLQPLWVLVTGHGTLHGFTHTYFWATWLGLLAALSGKYLGEFGLYLLRLPGGYRPIRWPVAFISAYIGVYSHVFLDGTIYGDMYPFAPFNTTHHGHFYDAISMDGMAILCLASAVIGGSAYLSIVWLRGRRLGKFTLE